MDTKGSVKTGGKSATPISFEGKRYLNVGVGVSVVVKGATVQEGRVDTFLTTPHFCKIILVLKMRGFSIKTQLGISYMFRLLSLATTRPNRNIQKKETVQLQCWSETSELTNVSHKVRNVRDLCIGKNYRGADKSLARPERKQVRKHVRDARDFDKLETRAVIKFLFLQGKAPKEIHAILTETLACFLPGRARV